jgi:hypothetical protein
MRQTDNTKSSYPTKASAKAKCGTLKRVPVKKIYCTKCQKLVKGQIQSSGATTRVICPRCTQHLRVWKVTSWKSVLDGVFTTT